MKIELNQEKLTTNIIDILLSVSSGIAAFQFVNNLMYKTAKRGGLFTRTGVFIISLFSGIKMSNYIYKEIKEVTIWQKLMSLV